VFEIKRLIGKEWENSEFQRDLKLFPFKIINHENKPYIQVKHKGETKIYSPEEIAALILDKMKRIASLFLGVDIENAVITCPTYFTDEQRQAIKYAGRLAGLNVIRITNEPTAAALAFGFHNVMDEKNILVFDLGGGTFDVTLISCDMGILETLSTSGDAHLGGSAFDQRLTEYALMQFKKHTNKDASSNKRAVQLLRKEAERVKIALSQQQKDMLEIDDFFDGESLAIPISRSTFEDLNMDLFKAMLGHVKQVLYDGNLRTSQIDKIVLVGGSSRIPIIQQLLEEFFNGKFLTKGIDPDETIAYGATIQAGIIADEYSLIEPNYLEL